jgi:hypothetical protein
LLLEYGRLTGETVVGTRDLGLPTGDGPVDLAERVGAALAAGQIAYIPGEVAKHIWHTPRADTLI